jgi:hypothetical protein
MIKQHVLISLNSGSKEEEKEPVEDSKKSTKSKQEQQKEPAEGNKKSGKSKQEQKKEPAESNKKSGKSKQEQQKEEDEEKILNETLEKLKRMTMPDVNIVREKPPSAPVSQQREAQTRKQSESGGEGKDSGGVGEGPQRRNCRRGGRQRRGKEKTGEQEGAEGMLEGEEEDGDSDNESVSSRSSQSTRGKGGGRRGRGRGASSLTNITRDSCERLDSDNESEDSQSSQPARGKGQHGRGGRGRRGGRGGDSQRMGRDQDGRVNEQPSHEFDDGEDEDFSESTVFKFLVQTLGGCASVSKFKQEFSPLPSDFDDWINKPKNRLSVYRRNHKAKFIGPFLRDATVCVDHMGFSKNQKCTRKDCNHFHICNFYLNGWCKRGVKCRKGHTFTKGNNRVLKAKLGLNPFKDAEMKTIIQCRYPQICRKIKCPDGDDCPYLHVCFNYIQNKCEDSNCQRGHDLETPHNMWVLSVYRMERWTKDKLALLKFLINMPRKPRSTKGPDDVASNVDPSECGSMAEDDFSDDMDEDTEDEDDSSDDLEDEVGEIEFDDVRNKRKTLEPKEEVPVVVEKKKLNRKDRWANPVPDTEFMDMPLGRNPDPGQPGTDNTACHILTFLLQTVYT